MNEPAPTPAPRWRDPALTAAVALVYLAFAVAWTWPYATVATHALPNGINPTSLPASAGTWALWWVADRATHGFVGLWDGPIFAPAIGTFGYSEPTIPLGLAVAPLFWLGASPATAYAVVVLGSLVANGLSVRWLAKVLGVSEVPASLAGAWVIASAMTWKWFAVMPLVPLFGMALLVGAALRAARSPSVRTALEVGGAFALTWLLCLQYGYFTTLVAPVLLLLAPVDRARVRAAAGAGVVAFLLLAPVLVPQQLVLAEQGMERTAERAEAGGASLAGMWGGAPVPARLWIPGPPATRGGMYPGTLLLACVALGVWARRQDREVRVVTALVVLSVVLSILPTIELGGFRPFELLRAYLPGLERIREPRRAAALAMVLLPVLAALGLDQLARRAPWLPALVVGLGLLNAWPESMPVQETPDPDPELVAALLAEVPDDGAVVFLPFEDGSRTPEVDRMVVQVAHGRRMVNGYSSYYPKSYWTIKRAAHPRVTPRLWPLLAQAGTTHVVAPPDLLPPGSPVERVRGGDTWVLYALVPGSAQP